MSGVDAPAHGMAWYRRLHAALMPQYNRAAAVRSWLAIWASGLLLQVCLAQASTLPAMALLQIAAGLAFAVGAGPVLARISGARVSFGVGELSINLALLLQGRAAASVLAAADAGFGWNDSRPAALRRRVSNRPSQRSYGSRQALPHPPPGRTAASATSADPHLWPSPPRRA